MNIYTFSIEVHAETQEEACAKFRDEEIQPEQMDIEEEKLITEVIV